MSPPALMRPPRSRLAYGIALVLVIAAGLGSRVFGRSLPAVVATYAGDTLYATMVFVGLGILAPRWSTARLAGTALACSFAIEASQLYHAPTSSASPAGLSGVGPSPSCAASSLRNEAASPGR